MIELLIVVGLLALGISSVAPSEISGLVSRRRYRRASVLIWLCSVIWPPRFAFGITCLSGERSAGAAIETEKFPPAIAYIGYAFGGFILVAIVSLASVGISARTPSCLSRDVFQYRPAVLMYMFAAVFVAPVVEETVFRGYLYPVFARSFGIGAGVVIVGTLFGLAARRASCGADGGRLAF